MDDQSDLQAGSRRAPRDLLPASLAVRAIGLTAGVALIVGVLIGPAINLRPVPALGADPAAAAEHTISVGGSASVTVTPDVADLVVGVSVERPNAKDARDGAASAMAGVIAAIKKDGVADKDIATTNVSLEPVYDYSNNGSSPRLVGQRFSNTVRITVRNLGSVAAVVDDTVSAGASTLGGITFRVDNPKPLQAQARQAAMDDARAKADALAKAAGVSIKGVASVAETSYTPNPVYMADGLAKAAAAPSTPIQTGTTDITVQVTVSYVIG